ncbi:4-hydroxy-3-methylbut-2-enyl diphosphate reductase [Bartonella sp. DGB1]|uniref:4-hydroxy-3-methylbut-2-enyl diphosphate reductase n=1 Tax=Bartonella sp. DGB1 TaxID=3239807 RepID=UPI003523DCC6
MTKQLTIRLCAPRGFCAGVERAIEIVVLAIKKYGKPVYVKHEIVHNQYVVQGLRDKGAIFIEELNEIPPYHRDRPVIFSAHGVPKETYKNAEELELLYLDATCPLVSKVHKQALKHYRLGRHVLLIGHAGHPEVIGTMGQIPEGSVSLIETIEDVNNFIPPANKDLGFVSQTTLSVEDTAEILKALKKKFSNIFPPAVESICYATTNRQQIVYQNAAGCDLFLIVGAPNSSNSQRLVEVAIKGGAKQAMLVQTADEIDWNNLSKLNILGLSAGASAPEIIVKEIIDCFAKRYKINIDLVQNVIETESFLVNKSLRDIQLTPQDMQFVKGA